MHHCISYVFRQYNFYNSNMSMTGMVNYSLLSCLLVVLVVQTSEAFFLGDGNCPANCTKFGNYHCYHTFTCPTPPCDKPVVVPGQCCSLCPGGKTFLLYSYKFHS